MGLDPGKSGVPFLNAGLDGLGVIKEKRVRVWVFSNYFKELGLSLGWNLNFGTSVKKVDMVVAC